MREKDEDEDEDKMIYLLHINKMQSMLMVLVTQILLENSPEPFWSLNTSMPCYSMFKMEITQDL